MNDILAETRTLWTLLVRLSYLLRSSEVVVRMVADCILILLIEINATSFIIVL